MNRNGYRRTFHDGKDLLLKRMKSRAIGSRASSERPYAEMWRPIADLSELLVEMLRYLAGLPRCLAELLRCLLNY